MNVGFSIRKARLEARLSQEELAQRAGINRTYLSQLENGRSSPTLEVLEKIARALNLETTALISETPAAREPEPQYEGERGQAPLRGLPPGSDPNEPIYPGLREFMGDKRTRLLMKPSSEEIAMLKGIRFLNRFSPSKELFIEVLLDYRRGREERGEEQEEEPAQS